jgi:hypothetical protein
MFDLNTIHKLNNESEVNADDAARARTYDEIVAEAEQERIDDIIVRKRPCIEEQNGWEAWPERNEH